MFSMSRTEMVTGFLPIQWGDVRNVLSPNRVIR